ncbi:uncharacterized protein LOC144098546 isoform X1 [Amblyomma americanum]
MSGLLQAALLLALAPLCEAPFLTESAPAADESDPLQEYVDIPGGGNVGFPNVLGGSNLLRLNNTRELIGSWTLISRYIVHVLAKDPVRPEFFSDFLQQRKDASFTNLLDQVRLHQPYVYQLFQAVVVLTNLGFVAGVSIILLRCMGTCGASTCQDVTINYRLLFHAYTASSWVVCAGVVFLAAFALSCDYSLDKGMKNLEKYVGEYKGRIRKFLDDNMVKAANNTLKRMSQQLGYFHTLFSIDFGYRAAVHVAAKLRTRLDTPSIFRATIYNTTFEDLVSGIQQNVATLREKVAVIDSKAVEISASVISTLTESTHYQRHGIIIAVADLMQQIRGQLYAFGYEVHHVEEGVKSMTTILFVNETMVGKNLLDLAHVKKIVTYSIVAIMVFVAVTMGGMMTGFTLGFANHYGHASPLERNALSNLAGYILVLTSHCMVFGASVMLMSAGLFMLLGCIGDIYLCRSQRSYFQGNAVPLKDLTISILMNATTNRHYVEKLLKFTAVEKHCKEHIGIGGLAGIKPKDLEVALDKIVEYQTDVVHHYRLNTDLLQKIIAERWNVVKEFQEEFNKRDLLYANNGEFHKKIKKYLQDDEKLYKYVTQNTSNFKELVKQSFLDFTIEECDYLKNNISAYIDEFDNIGICGNILAVFTDGFNILCSGMLDFVNGYWLSMMILVGIYVYGIYISLIGSKYLYTMKSYTYEGEPVPAGQIHKKQRVRKKVVAAPVIRTEDERLRKEDAERLRQIRLRKAMKAPDTQLKYLVPIVPTANNTANQTAKPTNPKGSSSSAST